MKTENHTIKQHILDYAEKNGRVEAPCLVSDLGVNINTARQYLCALCKEGLVVRVGKGVYEMSDKQMFKYTPSVQLVKVHNIIREQLPFVDLCVYDGSIFTTLQHNVAINNAFYVETNRDAVDSVFALLKGRSLSVYKQPDADFMYDYVTLQEKCIIVKTLVMESPVVKVNGVYTPSLEKILIDIQKDDDLGYMQGTEMEYIFQTALDLYVVNVPRLLRYARRRGAFKNTASLIQQSRLHD